jgi:hypothetical protein
LDVKQILDSLPLIVLLQEKESLITELRKELRVSDEEHRELLARVNADDIIRRIRFSFLIKYLLSRFLNDIMSSSQFF